MNPSCRYILFPLLVIVFWSLLGCQRDQKIFRKMDMAESLMASHPDSALTIMEDIDESALHTKAGKARYALLYSQALDRNVIELTSFEELQPAVEYYADHGSADD